MRDGGGNPFLPLATPSVEYLSMMLQDFSLTNNASNVLAHNLSLVGPILRDQAPEKEQVRVCSSVVVIVVFVVVVAVVVVVVVVVIVVVDVVVVVVGRSDCPSVGW